MKIDIKIDSHTHTTASGHAYSTVKEMVEAVRNKGLKGIAITDHAKAMAGAPTYLHFINLKCLPKIEDGVRIFSGVELNILNKNGDIDFEDKIINRLDFVMASIHVHCTEIRGFDEVTEAYLNVMDNDYVRVIGHPSDYRFPFDIPKVVAKAKERNVAFEVNNMSENPDCPRYDVNKSMVKILEECKKQGVYVTVGSDAHYYTEAGKFEHVYELFEEVDFPEELVLNANVERFEKFFGI